MYSITLSILLSYFFGALCLHISSGHVHTLISQSNRNMQQVFICTMYDDGFTCQVQ